MRVRAVQARHGDALIITTKRATILVDGGPPGTFSSPWRDELKRLPRNGRVELFMVSHIDDDHIAGVLELTASIEPPLPPLVDIKEFWHNSFSDLVASEKTGRRGAGNGESKVDQQSTGLASLFEAPGIDVAADEALLVLASVGQGRRLRNECGRLLIETNRKFAGGLVVAAGRREPWKKRGVRVTAIAPGPAELTDLRRKWRDDLPALLEKQKQGKTDPAAAAGLDRSVSNIASIVAVVEEVDGPKVLFTGDARGDLISDALRTAGLLTNKKPAHFDALKLPHHGSSRNVSKRFFEQVTADHYIVSGNGGHGNPEPAAIEMLLEARPELNYQIHMTYGPDQLAKNDSYRQAGNDVSLRRIVERLPSDSDLLRWPHPGDHHVDIDL